MRRFSSSKARRTRQLVIAARLKLIGIHLHVAAFNAKEFIGSFKYYVNPRFFLISLLFSIAYCFKSPYRISKAFLKKRNERNLYQYGETPLTTLNHIAKTCRIFSKDVFYELGCGRGVSCFWIASFIGCRAVGIDQIPSFIQKARWIQRLLNLDRLIFYEEDFMDSNFEGATVIYLYAITLAEEVVHNLICKLKMLPLGSKVITVSFPLEDLAFKVIHIFKGRYPWGEADIYLQIRSD